VATPRNIARHAPKDGLLPAVAQLRVGLLERTAGQGTRVGHREDAGGRRTDLSQAVRRQVAIRSGLDRLHGHGRGEIADVEDRRRQREHADQVTGAGVHVVQGVDLGVERDRGHVRRYRAREDDRATRTSGREPGQAEELHERVQVGIGLGVDVVLVGQDVVVDVRLGDRLGDGIDDLPGDRAGGGVQIRVGDVERRPDLGDDVALSGQEILTG
jgi:hypothetical protein